MKTNRLINLAPLSGLVMVALLVTGLVLTGSAGYRVSAERVVEYFTDSSSRIATGKYFGKVSIIFLIWFAGCIYQLLRNGEGQTERLSTVAFGGAVFTAVAIFSGFTSQGVGGSLASSSKGISLEVAALLHELYSSAMAGMFSSGLATFIGATGVASLRTKSLPEWFGWTSVLMAIGLVTPIHWLIEGLALIWIAGLSIWMLVRNRSTRKE